jgi:hypothetical protein
MLALAHKIQQAIDGGRVRDRAEVARRFGFTRARLTYLLDLTLLAPDVQEQVLFLEAVDGVQPMSERVLRAVAHAGSWGEQRAALRGTNSCVLTRLVNTATTGPNEGGHRSSEPVQQCQRRILYGRTVFDGMRGRGG